MKTLINFYKEKVSSLLLFVTAAFLILSSCEKSWEPSMTEIESGKTQLQIQINNREDGNVLGDVKVAIYSKPRGQKEQKLLLEGRTGSDGKLIIPDFIIPTLIEVQIVDSRFPPSAPVIMKVLSENTASLTMEVSTTWSEYNIYDRADWEVIAVSSQQSVGSGGQNIFIPGNATWHSQYSPVLFDFPHWLVIDMKLRKSIHGFALKNRLNPNGPMKDIEIFISDDQDGNWNSVGEFQMENNSEWQLFTLEKENLNGRYVKLIIKTTHTPVNKFTNLAEFGVY